ncbi:metal ABC transporter substrate-binding protein [Jannaschia sp. CCS1]|uniref:metal ABC transporter substrate-binding protein n=1 Tax=Jannaschia sp. (strain CCS1) TaxID=290400 RepID=UPI000053D26C|nr:metal ABC transporter substrate-binding protein [Jannaschia sp. CCS1]ABD56028.1 periplasmic solute binding protein [Jannaschia sp. CCS1]
MTQSVLTRRTFGSLTLATTLLGGAAFAQDRLQIAAVNYPLAYFAERLAGDLADVTFDVPSDVDPSFWRPGITDITAIQSADLILLNGAGFADWTARTTLPRSRTVMTSAAFEDAFITTETVTHSHGEGGQHSHTGVANYLWLDFAQAGLQAEAIAAAMTRRMADNSAEIAENLQTLQLDLAALGTTARDIGAAADGIAMIASHPRYQYLARAYGFDIEALDWDAQDPVTDEQWAALEAMIDETDARVFIWEAEPNAAALARVEALGLVNVVFPPLANRPDEGDFVTALSGSLARLTEAVQRSNGT